MKTKPRPNRCTLDACLRAAETNLSGESWVELPHCACPVIAGLVQRLAYSADAPLRAAVKVYAARLPGTRTSCRVEQRRGWLAADWIVRTHTPAWLDLANMAHSAEALRTLPKICSPGAAQAANARLLDIYAGAEALLDVAQRAAREVLGPGLISQVGVDVNKAVDVVRGASDGVPPEEALSTARGAARNAAMVTALNTAALRAARKVSRKQVLHAAVRRLAPTRGMLQTSALELLDRMIALTDDALGGTP